MTPQITNWRKSTRSGAQANCVEIGTVAEVVGIRDSKDPSGPALAVEPAAWSRFLNEVHTGALDG